MTRRTCLLAALTFALAACGSPARPPTASAPAPAPAAAAATAAPERYADAIHEDVIVGSFLGGDAVAMQRIGQLFGRYHIRWSAYGSLGYTLIVPTAQGALARAVLRDDPELAKRVSVLDPPST